LPSLAPISIGNMSLWRKKRKRTNKHQNKIRSKTNIVDEQHKCYPNNTSWAFNLQLLMVHILAARDLHENLEPKVQGYTFFHMKLTGCFVA
jgi:hypothetical protein